MSNLRMIPYNDGDAATLSATSEALAVDNLQRLGRSRVWRSTSTSDSITGDWSSGIAVSGVVLYRHNLTSNRIWRVRLWDATSQTGTLLYDSGSIDAWSGFDFSDWDFGFAMVWPSVTGVQSIQIDLDDSGNADGYLQAERLIVGDVWEPSLGIEYGVSLHWAASTKQARTAGGTLRATPAQEYRVLDASMGFLAESERADLMAVQRRVGKAGDVFVSGRHDVGTTEPEVVVTDTGDSIVTHTGDHLSTSVIPGNPTVARDYAMLGKMKDLNGISHEIPKGHRTQISIVET